MPLYSYPYDDAYDPSMPTVDVQIVAPESGALTQPVAAIVDSGADGTTIPTSLLDEIGALSIGRGIMSGIWGDRRPVKIYLVTLKIGGYTLRGIQAAGVPDTVGFVLGRNALNHMVVTLNGLASMTEIISKS
jgi:predicted aspartyl protease